MKRKIYASILTTLVCLSLGLVTSCGSSSKPTPASISATGGTPQSATVGTAFAPLKATVLDTKSKPVSGVAVTFTAPSGTGASCTLASTTVTTDPNGNASATCTANTTVGTYNVTAAVSGVSATASFSLTNTLGAGATISATGGTPQTATVNTAFASQLQATVKDSNSNPVSGVTVTFTAPAAGAGVATGTFSGLATASVTTNSSGQASATFTAGTVAGPYVVTAAVSGVAATASFSLKNTVGPAATITATGGTPQSTAVNTAFPNPLVATVVDAYSNPVSGVTVTFTAPPTTGASGTFAGGVNTATTNTSGVATSAIFTANATPGAYTVTAAASGVTTPASFSLANAANYVFSLSGLEAPSAANNSHTYYYALAGVATIDPSGNVLGGEQDYDDGVAIASPQPGGDSITGGTLSVNASGQGTLTLITNNANVGVAGTETLGVQFVNANHALIIQFDETATSSGSLDMQTATSVSDGNYAFIFSGVDTNYTPVGYGGVFSDSSGTVSGTADVNDDGSVTPSTTITGTLLGTDGYGRGLTSAITINGTALDLNYYVVGPEVLRIIDVEIASSTPGTGGAALGSAFGQGTTGGVANTFTSASLGPSVLGLEGNPMGFAYAAAGMFATTTTSSTAGTFQGTGEDDLEGTVGSVATIKGSYTVGSNGYGTFVDNLGGLPGIFTMGMYMTDPALNLLDPNNQANGGGALFLALDSNLSGGTGIVLPQTSTADFSSNTYAFGAQDYNDVGATGGEFDFVGLGPVASDALTGTGLVNDEFEFFSTTSAQYEAVPISGTATPDTVNVGRYTMVPLDINVTGTAAPFTVVIYQANLGQLIWMDEDTDSLFLGTLQQQGSLTGMPAVKKPPTKAQVKHKH